MTVNVNPPRQVVVTVGGVSKIETTSQWGLITGTLSNQTDLQNALNAKADAGDIPTALSELSGDSTHRVVTDTEKSTWNGKQDALGFTPVPTTRTVAGKALSADVTIAKADVGLGNVDNTSDANKPVSTAQATAIGLKQDTLVSGTNIKTVNSQSLLGSGDIVIAGGGGTWGSITGTLSAQTDLQNALNAKMANWASVAFNPTLTLQANTVLAATTVTGAITFTVSGSPVPFAETYVRLTANGTNVPTFSGLTKWPGSPDYVNTNGVANHISFFNNGVTSFYSITPDNLTAFDPATKQDTLISGTNIKTVNSTSILGSGDLAVQPTLVSGTNIKTINSATVLGSGDVALQVPLVSGTNIKTINGSSVLGSGDLVVSGGGVDPATTLEILDHLILAAGGRGPMALVDYSGNGGANGATSPANSFGAYGALYSTCGATATIGANARMLGSGVIFNMAATKRLVIRSRISSAANFDGTNTGALYWGYYNNSGTNAPRDGIFFRQANGGNLFAVTMKDSTETATDLGLSPTLSTWYNFEVRINSGGTSAGFYLNGTPVATHTTNIPTGLVYSTGPGWWSVKTSAHTVAVEILSDLVYQKIVYDSPLF